MACSKFFFLTSFYVFILARPWGMWDLSSLTRDKPVAPALEVQSLNHWTVREVPQQFWPCCQHGFLSWSYRFNHISSFLALTYPTFPNACSLGHHLVFPSTWLQSGLLRWLRNLLIFFRISKFLESQIISIFWPLALKLLAPVLQSVLTNLINWRHHGQQGEIGLLQLDLGQALNCSFV